MFKSIVVLALISILAVSAAPQEKPKKSCSDLRKEGEAAMRKLFLMEDGAIIPKTQEDVKTVCDDGKKLFSSMLEYKSCLSLLPQQIFTTTTTSIGKVIKDHCATQEGRDLSLKLAQCTTPERVRESTKCGVGSLNVIDELSKSDVNDDQLIAQICCLTHLSTECAREKMSSVTCPDPTVKPIEHFEKILTTVSNGAFDLACDNYQTLAVCNEKIPTEVTKMRTTIANAPSEFGNRSLFEPLMAISEKMAS